MTYKLRFIHKQQVAADSWVLMFQKPDGFVYEVGQYVQINLPHPSNDKRGSARWFTLSSSPTEGDLMITTRLVKDHSSFKEKLFSLKPGDSIQASEAQGDFILPPKPKTELVWIAGGIGITPFRSQIKFLLDNQQYNRRITLIYSNRTEQDICFTDLWAQAIDNMPSFRLIQTLVDEIPKHWGGEQGLVDEAMIGRATQGLFANKHFYVSGPEPMVEAFKPKLIQMGINEEQIHQDWFPNYTETFFKTV